MEETIARYQTEMEELQKSRKEIIKQAKEEAERILQESNARIENTIRTIKEAQAEKEKTRLARQELTDFRTSLDALASKEQEERTESCQFPNNHCSQSDSHWYWRECKNQRTNKCRASHGNKRQKCNCRFRKYQNDCKDRPSRTQQCSSKDGRDCQEYICQQPDT